MIINRQEDLTPAVLEVMAQTTEPRLREIMLSLIKHLHGFVREVNLTEAEFRNATAILNEIGQGSNDNHNEMVLMAGSLGVSSLVCLLNNGDHGATETSQNLLGPFWRMHSPRTANGSTIVRSATTGSALFVNFRVIDRAGQPVADAEVDIWHAEFATADGRQAVKLVRQRAAEWGIAPDRIGLMGFSAGGMLTMGVVMKHDAEGRPNFAAPIYGGNTNGQSVAADAPPLLIAVASDDPIASVSSAKLYLEWKAAKRPAELHIYSQGGHGFGMTKRGLPVDSWVDRFGEWLQIQGLLK